MYDYSEFVSRVKNNMKERRLSFDDAVNESVDFAIKNNFLEGFFAEQRGYILGDFLTEFDEEAYLRHRYAEGHADGVRENAIENARNLLAMNILTSEQIAQAVSLPLEQVLTLREELTVTNS